MHHALHTLGYMYLFVKKDGVSATRPWHEPSRACSRARAVVMGKWLAVSDVEISRFCPRVGLMPPGDRPVFYVFFLDF